MRSEIERLEAVGGPELTQELLRLLWQCWNCDHVRFAQDVDKPREFRALATHKVTCAQGRELPAYGRLCPGLTRGGKAYSNERPQKALPSCVACDIMGTPKNTTRLHKGLSDSPKSRKNSCYTAFADFTCRFFGQVFSHIGQICNVRGPVRARRSRCGRGALQICPFSFPKHNEVSHV